MRWLWIEEVEELVVQMGWVSMALKTRVGARRRVGNCPDSLNIKYRKSWKGKSLGPLVRTQVQTRSFWF